MIKKTLAILLISIFSLSFSLEAGKLKKTYLNQDIFHVNYDTFFNISSKNSDKFLIFEKNKKIDRRPETSDIQKIPNTLLTVEILPVSDTVLYITFPDAGNMLVLLDSTINAAGLLPKLDKLMTKNKKEAFFMKIIGWKPRLDWLVVAAPLQDHAATIKTIVEKFNVREIMSPENLKLDLKGDVKHTQLRPDYEIDLLQTVSSVKITSLGTDKINKEYLVLELAYVDFKFLLLPDISTSLQKDLSKKYFFRLDNQIFITFNNNQLDALSSPTGPLYTKSSPGMMISGQSKLKFITGGRMLYITNTILR